MRRILFVCAGNTCRSPMAQAIVKTLVHGDTTLCSAGVGTAGRMSAARDAIRVMKERGIDLSQYSSRSITE